MNQRDRKFKKQKKREKESKEKVRRRRERARKLKKEQVELEKAMDAEASVFDKQKPFLNPDTQAAWAERDKQHNDDIQAQIEHNLKILEELETEYLKEELAREELNTELEEQGFTTVEEKVNYLKEKAQKEAEAFEKEHGMMQGRIGPNGPSN